MANAWRSTGGGGLAAIADKHLLANTSGASATPTDTALSTLIDSALGSTRGAVLSRGASGWAIITPGTSGFPLVSSGAGADPSYAALSGAAKAWCYFDGTVAGTNAPTAGFNVATVQRTNYGRYKITMTNALANANYAVLAFARDNVDGIFVLRNGNSTTTQTSSICYVEAVNTAATDYIDLKAVSVVMLGA